LEGRRFHSYNELCVTSREGTMRPFHSTITPRAVRARARQNLRRHLGFTAVGRLLTAHALIDLILLLSALRATLSAIVRRFRFGCSHETARQALHANLADQDTLTQRLLQALLDELPAACLRYAWDIALDRHDVPFYGPKGTPGVLGGPKKKGTNRCYAYVSAVIVCPRYRYTVALAPLTDARFWPAVQLLLDQMQRHDIRIRTLLLDRGFFSADLVTGLTDRGIPFVVGVPKKSKRWQPLFEMPTGELRHFSWTNDRTGETTTATMVNWRRWRDPAGRRRQRPAQAGASAPLSKRSRRQPRPRASVEVVVVAIFGLTLAAGLSRWQRALAVKRSYRRRFGIETSYRQMNQGKGWTTSTHPGWRFLLVGVALVLRQAWVSCQGAAAEASRLAGTDAAGQGPLRLVELLAWLAAALQQAHPPLRMSLLVANPPEDINLQS
jgi:Transposase DDE domain